MEPLTATRLQVCTPQPVSICPGSCPLRFSLLDWIKTLMGTIVHASQGFAGQQQWCIDERIQLGVWQDV